MASHLPLKSPAARDTRIDFWRGLCLIDMILDHLVWQGMPFGQPWYSILGEYTRFAAGGFIMISGMSIGAIFLKRISDPQRKWPTYRRLWRRSGYILLVHYVATTCFLLIYPLLGGEPFQSVPTLLWQILIFRQGSDLLPFYVVMVALTPGMLELVQRGKWWVLALLSLGGFIFGLYHPYFLMLPIQTTFMILPWQFVFVFGVLCGAALPHYDKLAPRIKTAAAAAAVVFMAVMFFAAYGGDWGLKLSLPLVFWKIPLSVGETLKYLAYMLAMMLVSDRVWRWIGQGGFVGFSARMGRRSLAMYVVHVFFVAFLIHWAKAMEWSGTHALLLALLGVLGLWAVAKWMDVWKAIVERPIRWPAVVAWWRSAFNVPAMGLAAIILLLTVNAVRWQALHPEQEGELPEISATAPLEIGPPPLVSSLEWLQPARVDVSSMPSADEWDRG